MKWELLLPGCTTNSTPRPPPPSPLLPRTAAALFHQAGKGVTKSTCNLATFHCIAGCRLPPPAAACRRLLANFLQRNFGDASVPPADTATCRAPASSLRSVPPPVTLTLDLTLLEFFNYTTSASSGIGKRWRTCNAAARQLNVKQCASMCGKVAALRSAMLQPV